VRDAKCGCLSLVKRDAMFDVGKVRSFQPSGPSSPNDFNARPSGTEARMTDVGVDLLVISLRTYFVNAFFF